MTVMLHVHITSSYASDYTYKCHWYNCNSQTPFYAHGCLLKLKCFCSSNIIYDYCFIIMTFWRNKVHYRYYNL